MTLDKEFTLTNDEILECVFAKLIEKGQIPRGTKLTIGMEPILSGSWTQKIIGWKVTTKEPIK